MNKDNLMLTSYHRCSVSNPSSDLFLEILILFSKFLFQDDLFSLDEDEPEYDVYYNYQKGSNNTTPNNDQAKHHQEASKVDGIPGKSVWSNQN